MKTTEINVDYLGGYGSDLTVVNAARVSFHKESKEFQDSDARLLQYLSKNKHHSPFNHAFLSFRVKAPIFVARQLVKHKFMPWNEVSRRYVDEEPEFYIPVFRERVANVKQGSGNEYSVPAIEYYFEKDYLKTCLKLYNDMLESNICPEQARMVLPLNTMTEWIWSGTLGAFLDMLVLRLDPHTQKETQEVAQDISNHVFQLFPESAYAYLHFR